MIGDYGEAGQPEADVAALVDSWEVDFIVTVGDNNYPDGEASTIDENIGQYYRAYIYPYQGNYSGWLEQKAVRLAQEEKQETARQRKIRRELSWVRASPRARQAKSKAKQVDRIVIEELPQSSRRYPRFGFSSRRSSGKTVLRVENVSGDRTIKRHAHLSPQSLFQAPAMAEVMVRVVQSVSHFLKDDLH